MISANDIYKQVSASKPSSQKSSGSASSSNSKSSSNSGSKSLAQSIYDQVSAGKQQQQQQQKQTTSWVKQDFVNRYNSYINSGKSDYNVSKGFYSRASEHAANATNEEDKKYWSNLANKAKGLYEYDFYNGNRGQYEAAGKELEELKANKQTTQNNLKGYQQAVYTGSQAPDILAKYDQALKENANYDKRIKELEAQRAQLDEEFFNALAPENVKEARALLESGKVSGTGFSSNNTRDNIMGAMGKSDKGVEAQKIVDDWMQSYGMNQAYFNGVDRAVGGARSAYYEIGSGLEGAASVVGKALNEADMSGMNVMGVSDYTGSTQKNKEAREAQKERIGLPDSPATDEYLRWYNEESAKFDDPQYAFENSRDAFEAEARARQEALITPELEALDKRIEYLEIRQASATKATGEYENSEVLRQAQQDAATLRDLKKQRQEMQDRLKDVQGKRDETSLRYKLATDYQNDIFQKMDARVDELDAKSQAEIAKAKERATSYGKVLLDMEKTGLEMGFDMAAGALTGGGSLVPMFIRVMGNESAAARREGASVNDQLKYGLTKAGIEVATEKLFGAFDKIGYGKGIASEMSERIVKMLADSPLGRTVVRAVISAVEEGAEEGLADLLAPIADKISYRRDESFSDLFKEETANFWYDVLLGAAMGGLGTVTGIATGQNAQANADLYIGEVLDTMQAQENKAAADKKAMDEALASGDEAKVQAVLNQAGNVPQSKAYKVLAKIQQIKQQVEAEKPITETLTREEAAIARSMGLIDKDSAKLLMGPTERQKAKANQMVEKSTSKSGERRETIISNAEKEGVKTKSDRIREGAVEDDDSDMLPPMPEGPQSAKEAIALEKAKANEQQKKSPKRTAEEKAAANKRMFDNMRRSIEDTYSAEDLETSKRLYDEKSSELEGLKEGDTLHSKDGGETAVVVFADDEGVGIRVFDENGNELVYDRIPKGYMPKGSPYMTYNLAPDSTTPRETGIIDADTAESVTPQETPTNAPEGQAPAEGTPVAPAEEKEVKPVAESPEQGPEEPERRAMPAGVRKKSKRAEQEKTQVRPAIENAEERARDVAEKFGVSDGTYISLTREKVSEIAKYWIEKYTQKNEYNRLIDSKQWNRVDFSEAGKIAYDMTMKLNHDMTDGRRGLGPVLQRLSGESYEEYRARQKASDDAEYQRRRAEIDALLAAYAEQKSIAGQNLQEQYKYSVADEIRIRASKRFLSYSENGEVHNTDWSINTKLWNVVDDLLTRMEAAETAGNTQEMVELTKMVSRIRSRQNMLGKAGVKAENFMFNRMMKFGLDADKLATLAYGNINKIMDDITPISYADAIESVRMTNMLSNIATGLNNILNNAVSARTGSIAQNASIPFARAFEKLTGKKVAVGDKSLIRSKEILRAEEVAYEYAVLSAYYGLNTENGRLDVRGTGGTFSVMDSGVSGFVERALARYNFLVTAFVLSPDAPVKARVQTGIQQSIDKAFEGEDLTDKEVLANKHELEGFAAHEAKRRTLQDDNRFTNAVLYVKQHLLGAARTPGEHKVIKGRELGSLDLGQFMIAFAKVPTNVGIQKVAATPYGTLYHVAQYAYTLAKAKADPSSVSVMEMAKASRNVGRAATTWGSIALGALAAATGALKNFDDTDDDEEKKLAAEKGYKGLMLNLSELFRPGNEWKDGDLILNANFLEILATPLSIGAMMYDARQEGAGRLQAIQKGTWESFTGMVDAIMEIPGLQQVGELYQAFANRDPNDGDFKSAVKAIGQFSVNTGTSYFLPNIVSQATAGWDNAQRDIYSTNSYGETLRNIVMAKIPGLRQKLPEKTDALGNTRTYGENRFMSVINTVLLPGDIKRYHISELEKELMRIKKETGYSGTFIDTKGPRKIEVGDNEYALDADQRRAFHETKAKYIAEAYDAFRTSDIYQSLTDEQRLDVYKSLRMDAERMTKNEALELADVDDRVTMDKWETELDLEGKIQYLSVKQMAGMYWDKSENSVTDFAGMDEFIKGEYKNLSEAQKKLLNGSYAHLDDLADAAKNGINSEKWQAAYNIYQTYTVEDENGKRIFKSDLKNEAEMWSKIQRATGFADDGREMRWIQNDMELTFTGSPNTSTYDELIYDYGLSRESASKIYNHFSTIQPTKGYADVQDRQKWVGLTKCGLPDKEQWDSFFAMVPSNNTRQIANMRALQNKINLETGNKYTFKEAIHQLKLDVIYWKEVLPNGKEKKHEIK